MTKLTTKGVREFIKRRYPEEKILAVELFETKEMAFVLTMYNTSCVSRYVIDINSDGNMDVWSHDCVTFNEIYRRREW